MEDTNKIEQARRRYIGVEVKLLEMLSGDALEMLNEMIDAHCEYDDLISC